MISKLLFKENEKKKQLLEKGKELLGIVWWIDPCETKEVDEIESLDDFPVYKTRGTFIDGGDYFKLIKEETLNVEAGSSLKLNLDERENQITNIPKALVKQRILVEVTEDQIELGPFGDTDAPENTSE